MLLICIVIALALFMYGLPACLSRASQADGTLFGRIEQEQKARLDQSFHQRKTRWQLVRILENNNHLMNRLCLWTGIDRQKTTEILSRLGWRVRLAEVILLKALSMVLIASALLNLAVHMSIEQSLKMVNGLPLIGSLMLYMLPSWLLDWGDKRAKDQIREQVPVFFSIVQSLVEAGMPIQAAVKETAQRFDARLGYELARLEFEQKRYGTWRKALEELAFRWEVDALTTIALEMNEAISKGVSIAQMLSVQVEEQMRQQEDEASAHMNRLNIRLLPFVILLMGVPLLFLVMGPALIGIGDRL
ncbi:type II secretion system F family protein [Brevibacillus sp. SIMBA_040]|uniref:type II secretion system F family protein n=1 Tax=unclassified Brevibacillus TaxID=2684853 RepID=UPI00397A15AD